MRSFSGMVVRGMGGIFYIDSFLVCGCSGAGMDGLDRFFKGDQFI